MILQAIKRMNSSRSSFTDKTHDDCKQQSSKGLFRLSFRSKQKRTEKSPVKGEDDSKLAAVLEAALKIDSKSTAIEKRKCSTRTVLDDFEEEHYEFFYPQRKTTHNDKSFDGAVHKIEDVTNDHGKATHYVRDTGEACENQPKNNPTEGRTRRRMSLTGQHTLEMIMKQSAVSRSSSSFKELTESDAARRRSLGDMIAEYEDLVQSNEE
jgi:hypothetical protein